MAAVETDEAHHYELVDQANAVKVDTAMTDPAIAAPERTTPTCPNCGNSVAPTASFCEEYAAPADESPRMKARSNPRVGARVADHVVQAAFGHEHR